ncbi:hypothetical protein D0962_36805 [Leptolyngbyaceae cyanobacterium CCMR0082]|uniref:Uncharacterized protein n=1 Tax=Adonisia turfae CCMR0082 TaxID=2304604 RepID=A0A6M0SI41_9CYAN|nr:hypothetical protein [Adonisia turfae CCMR0082]
MPVKPIRIAVAGYFTVEAMMALGSIPTSGAIATFMLMQTTLGISILPIYPSETPKLREMLSLEAPF